jgi:hypothetical protein
MTDPSPNLGPKIDRLVQCGKCQGYFYAFRCIKRYVWCPSCHVQYWFSSDSDKDEKWWKQTKNRKAIRTIRHAVSHKHTKCPGCPMYAKCLTLESSIMLG